MTEPKKNPKKTQRTFSDEFKMQAVALFYSVGNYKAAARELGIERKSLRNWVSSPDGQKWLRTLRDSKEEEFRNIASELVFKSLDQLKDRLDNGNVRTAHVKGELKEWREPLQAKDLTYSLGILVDKLRVSMNLPTRVTKTEDGGANLLKEFERLTDNLLDKKVEESIPGESTELN